MKNKGTQNLIILVSIVLIAIVGGMMYLDHMKDEVVETVVEEVVEEVSDRAEEFASDPEVIAKVDSTKNSLFDKMSNFLKEHPLDSIDITININKED